MTGLHCFPGSLVSLIIFSLVACQSPRSELGDAATAAQRTQAEPRQLPELETSEDEPAIRFPEDPVWHEALPVGGDVERPKKVSGPEFDLYGRLGGRGYYLAACFLGLVIGTDGKVERAYFLAPANASEETRDLFLTTVRAWEFEPATRAGVAVRVRYILSISDCPYLPAGA